MCGIIGFVDNIVNKETILNQSLKKIIHRGPDNQDSYIDENIALGFRQLNYYKEQELNSISNDDSNLIIVLDGEIYNKTEIKSELIKKGYRFKTMTTSEILVKGYQEYGAKILNKLRGMFAFAIWNKSKQELFIARDNFGIKPLYYTNMNKSFIFSSEIKAMLNHPYFKKELNEEALENYLSFQYSICDITFFTGVYKLLPGHYAKINKNKMEIKRYFTPKFKNKEQKLDTLVQKIEKEIADSISVHTRTITPGTLLSSGVDSSFIAALSKTPKTFTVGFEHEQYNKISYSEKFADTLKLKNYSKTISSEDYFTIFPKLQYHLDEPLADPAIGAIYYATKEARRHTRVALSGVGADELFGGYKIYLEPIRLAKYQKLPKIVKAPIAGLANTLPNFKGKSFLKSGSKKLENRYIGNKKVFSYQDRRKLLNIKTNALKPKEIVKTYYQDAKDYDETTKMQYIDIHTWLIGDILLKTDKISMANSLELRTPFLDKEVFKLASSIQTSFKVNKENTKYALRLAANNNIPAEIANKSNLGWPVPTKEWLREERYYKAIKESFNNDISLKYFNNKIINKLIDDHYKQKNDNSRKIWTIYTFIVWYNQFFQE